MGELRIRASALGKIMTSPTAAAIKAGEVLSVGAKTYIRGMARAEIFGIEPSISSKAIEKGIRCESDAIALYNAAFFTSYEKNTERKTDDYFTGECDLLGDIVIDVKTPWSIDTFPICALDAANADYEWQLRAYMRLYGRDRSRLAYCLVNTPEDLIGYESPESHTFDHVAEALRVTVLDFERDADKEAEMVAKVVAARTYYAEVIAEFARTHA